MPLLFRLLCRARWIHSVGGILILLLQRTPVVRLFVTAESALTTPMGDVLRALVPTALALGAVDSLAGASTQLVANINQPAKATVGTPFSETVLIQGLGVSFAQSWTIANTAPPGIVPQGASLQGGRWVVNPSSGTLTLSGTPTTAGTYSFSISGYQYTGLTGPVTTATATITVSPAPNAAPVVTRAPSSVTLLAGGTTSLSVTYTGTPAPTFQWYQDGAAIAGATSATLTLTNVTASTAGAYTVKLTNSLGSVTSAVATVTVTQASVAPSLSAAPASQTVVAGDPVQFTVAASGTPTPALQWLKNGVAIAGATDATLSLAAVQLSDAGTYTATASNSVGSVTSAGAQLTVNPLPTAPSFSTPPISQTVAAGATVVFSAPAVGVPAPTYQWLFNGTAIPGATSPMLMIARAATANVGTYTALAQNSLGAASSATAALAVTTTNNPGRLINLSVLTDVSSGVSSFTLGTVIGGAATSGSKAVLFRAAGPSLGALGVPGTLASPALQLFSGSTSVASNAGWGGSTTMANVMAAVGAFAYTSPASLDSAIYQAGIQPGSYSVQVSGVNGAVGSVIAEIYDATPASSYTLSTPRLTNVSVLKQIAAGGSLTQGFTIGGSTAKTILVRAVGPGLAGFGIGGFLPDPQLALFDSSSTPIAANDNWGGDAQLSTAMNAVGDFALTDPASKDSVLLVTLPPGGYTATASGVGGTGGQAIVEVYEVP
jgi:hypothetical protein